MPLLGDSTASPECRHILTCACIAPGQNPSARVVDGRSPLHTECLAVKRTTQDEVARFTQPTVSRSFSSFGDCSEMSHVSQSIYGRESRRGEDDSVCVPLCVCCSGRSPRSFPSIRVSFPNAEPCRVSVRSTLERPGKFNFQKEMLLPLRCSTPGRACTYMRKRYSRQGAEHFACM